MSLEDGAVVRFDYVLHVDGKAVETSMAEAAQEHGLLDPERTYQPLTVTLGGRQIIVGLEDELKAKGAPDAEFTAVIPAEKAYGARDVHKVKDVPMAEFRKKKVDPQVGMMVQYDNQRATVTRVAGGRVRIDMNHELAGKDLTYDVVVREIVDDDAGKVDAVLKSMFQEGAKFDITDDRVEIEVPDGAKFDREWPMHKFRLLTAVRQALGVETTIRLVETYPAQVAEAPPAAADAEEE